MFWSTDLQHIRQVLVLTCADRKRRTLTVLQVFTAFSWSECLSEDKLDRICSYHLCRNYCYCCNTAVLLYQKWSPIPTPNFSGVDMKLWVWVSSKLSSKQITNQSEPIRWVWMSFSSDPRTGGSMNFDWMRSRLRRPGVVSDANVNVRSLHSP